MNIKELLKKYGILCVIAVLFIGAIGYFAYDSNKGKIIGKTDGGKDVVVSLSGYNVTADDLYDSLIDGQYGGYALYIFYERAVVAASVESDKDMESSAKIQADQLIEEFKTQYGDSYKEVLNAALLGVGLKGESDLNAYFLHYLKLDKMVNSYIDANLDTLIDPYLKEKQPRYASHILIAVADEDNPTDAEKQKLADAKAALAGGMSFADAAKEFSDDGSASTGGVLGLVDKDTSFVEPFLSTTLALGHDQVSEWIKTEFGWHLIYVTEARPEVLKKDEAVITAATTDNSQITVNVIKEAAAKLDIKFTDEKLQAKLDAFMTVSEGE